MFKKYDIYFFIASLCTDILIILSEIAAIFGSIYCFSDNLEELGLILLLVPPAVLVNVWIFAHVAFSAMADVKLIRDKLYDNKDNEYSKPFCIRDLISTPKQPKTGFTRISYNQNAYTQQNTYARQNGYAQQNAYAQQNGYAQQHTYIQQKAYDQQNNFAQQNAYSAQPQPAAQDNTQEAQTNQQANR